MGDGTGADGEKEGTRGREISGGKAQEFSMYKLDEGKVEVLREKKLVEENPRATEGLKAGRQEGLPLPG